MQIINKIKKGISNKKLQHSSKMCKRMHLCLLRERYKKGSMTVEASMVLPLFIFVILNLTSIMGIYERQMEGSMTIYNVLKPLALESSEEYVYWIDTGIASPMIGAMGFNKFIIKKTLRTRCWNGYDNTLASKNGKVDEEYVYITPNGTVYHTTELCSYLKLSLRVIDKDKIDSCRNENGEKYTACEKCCKKVKLSTVYITKYGNKYHTTLDCNTIKRNVTQIPISQVGSRHECSKCKGDR